MKMLLFGHDPDRDFLILESKGINGSRVAGELGSYLNQIQLA